MNAEKTIETLENGTWWDSLDEDISIEDMMRLQEALDVAIAALRAQQEAEKNEPLTLEELRKMDGEPIYLLSEKYKLDDGWTICYGGDTSCNEIWWIKTDNGDYETAVFDNGDIKAYRRKPKEE